jgi:hypothetical protein
MAIGFAAAMPLVGAGLGALFGDDEPPGLTPEQRRIWQLLKRRYQAEHRYSNSATLSTPVERQSLAQAQGLQSEASARSRAGLFSQNGVGDMANPAMLARQQSNLGAAEMAQSNALYGQFALQGLQDRFNTKHQVLPGLLGQMSGVASSPAMPGQSSGWESMIPLLSQAGYMWGQRSQSNPMTGGGTTFGTGMRPASQPTWGDPDDFWNTP